MSKTKKPTPDELKSRFFKLMSVTDSLPDGLSDITSFYGARSIFNTIVMQGAADTCIEDISRFYKKNGAYVRKKGDGISWHISFHPLHRTASRKMTGVSFER